MHNIKRLLNTTPELNTPITINGWVRTRRDSKAGLSFISLTDGSCFATLQVIAPATLANYDSDIRKLTTGCAIRCHGTLSQSPGKNQAIELTASQIEVIGWVENPESYPMAAKRHTMEHLRDHTHLRMRTNVISATTRVRHGIAQAVHQFFHQRDFFWINTPIITACDCEGAGELFTVSNLDMLNLPRTEQGDIDWSQDFFGQRAYLTVSGQLNVEAYCLAMSKVYTFGPTFRAENSNTTRHLAEFWMIEPEIAFADLIDDMDLAEQFLKYITQSVLENHDDDMQFFNQWVDKGCLARLTTMLEKPFERLRYDDAIRILSSASQRFEHPVEWGMDLQTEHERYLCEQHCQQPVIVYDYPTHIKAFYMRLNDDNRTVAAMDVLLPGVGEIIGGSQREERLDVLTQRIIDAGLNPTEYDWYLDLRRYGSVPHAGFGLGFERLIRYITGVSNVRDVIPYARAPQHLPPNKAVNINVPA